VIVMEDTLGGKGTMPCTEVLKVGGLRCGGQVSGWLEQWPDAGKEGREKR
jgi:hypothetical protein